MKNVLNCLLVLLVVIMCVACAKEVAIPLIPTQSEFVQVEEEYQIDTIITFDADTFEETIEIVKTKITSPSIQKDIPAFSDDVTYRIDTIVTFDADTYEETIEIVRTKIEREDKKN